VTSTRPSLSTTAAARARGTPMDAAGENTWAAPSYTSAVAEGPSASSPPATSTRPSARGTAAAPVRVEDIPPVEAQVPVGTWGASAL